MGLLVVSLILQKPLAAQDVVPAANVPVAVPSQPVAGEAAGVGAAGVTPLPEPDPYIDREKGVRAMDTGDFVTAAGFFRTYREATQNRDPDLADATILLGKALLLGGKPQEALTALEFRRKHSTADLERYYQDSLTYVRGAALLKIGQPAEAIKALLSSTDAAADAVLRNLSLLALGDAYVSLRQWNQAEEVLSRFLGEFPKDGNAGQVRLSLMRVLLASGQSKKAAACLSQLEKEQGDLPKLLVGRFRVHVLLLSGEFPQAFEAYERIAGERPRQPDTEWWILSSQLAAGLFGAGKLEESLIVLSHATGLAVTENDRLNSMLQTAEVYILLSKSNLAIDALEKIRKEFPKRPEIIPVMVKLAELLRATENYMTAGEYFGQVVANPAAAVGFRYRSAISRGWCFREAGQFGKAVQTFLEGEALGSTPAQKGNAVFLAAESAYHVSDYATAAVHYRQVAEKYPETEHAEGARFREGRSLFANKEYAAAAQAYGIFLQGFPASTSLETAELERGIALRFAAKTAADFAVALLELQHFAGKHPASISAPRACMEAFESALGAEKPQDAVSMLTALIDGYPDSELFPHSLYERARLYFDLGENAAAVVDSRLFLEKFPLLPLAPDVSMWLGDHFANVEDYELAKTTYLKLVTTHPTSDLTPAALFESALCDYRVENLASALALAGKLEAMSSPKPDAVVLGKIHMLHGDILARQGNFGEAIPHFSAAREAAADSPLGLAALGRRGDMYISLAGDKQENAQEALDCFASIVSNENVPPDLLEVARFRMAKCYELLGETDKAIESYLSVYYQYEHDLERGVVRDWFYYYRSAYAAAHLYELSGKKGKLRLAARLYERLAKSRIPIAEEADRRAREIRRNHDMAD